MKLEKLSSVATPEIATKPKDDPKKVMAAAKEFEALLIGQMMKSMSQKEGWMGSGDDQASSSAMDYAQETFAQSLSKSGGLGLANMIFKGLKDA